MRAELWNVSLCICWTPMGSTSHSITKAQLQTVRSQWGEMCPNRTYRASTWQTCLFWKLCLSLANKAITSLKLFMFRRWVGAINHIRVQKFQIFFVAFFSLWNSVGGCDIVHSHLRVCLWGMCTDNNRGISHLKVVCVKFRFARVTVQSLDVVPFHLMKLW